MVEWLQAIFQRIHVRRTVEVALALPFLYLVSGHSNVLGTFQLSVVHSLGSSIAFAVYLAAAYALTAPIEWLFRYLDEHRAEARERKARHLAREMQDEDDDHQKRKREANRLQSDQKYEAAIGSMDQAEQAWLRLFIDLGISSLRSDALDEQNDNIAKTARVNSSQAELARRRLVERDYLFEDGWKVEVSSHLFRLLSANPHWIGSKAPVRLHAPR